jgi:MFS family permease
LLYLSSVRRKWGNGDLLRTFDLSILALGSLTSAVQLGFITGTLLFAFYSFADRFLPSKVFFICALLGAVFNLGLIWEGNNINSLLLWRFLTGFSLAGIYPVGMKIASDYFREGLGKSLGYLVGALYWALPSHIYLKPLPAVRASPGGW